MTDLSIRPSVTNAPVASARRPNSEVPLLVGLSEMLAARPDLIGARAARLSLATRSGLPIPAGSVVTAAALGCMDDDSRRRTGTTAEAIGDVFVGLGCGGRVPLMVSVSAVSQRPAAADRIMASCAVSSRSELLHTVRRLSATASVLGDTIAVVVQRDMDIAASGTLIASTADVRVADSIESKASVVDDARLERIGRRIADVFDGERLVAWSIDRRDQIWIHDIGGASLASVRQHRVERLDDPAQFVIGHHQRRAERERSANGTSHYSSSQ